MVKTSDDFSMKTIEKIGVISEGKTSSLELRKTEVKDTCKWDIRAWWTDKNGEEKYGKGIRLTDEELYKLGEIINNMDSFD